MPFSRQQRGMAAMLLVSSIMFVMIGFVAFLQYQQYQDHMLNRDPDREQYLFGLVQSLEEWHDRNFADVTIPGHFPATEAQLWGSLGEPPQMGVRLAISAPINRVVGNGVTLQYRNIHVWYPPDAKLDTSSVDGLGNFVPADPSVRFSTYSTFDSVNRHYLATLQRLNEVALLLEQRGRAKYLADPNHDAGVNYFRPTDTNGCVRVTAEEMPCANSYTDMSNIGVDWPLVAGIPSFRSTGALALTDAPMLFDDWGHSFQISTFDDVSKPATAVQPSDLVPTYQASLRAVLPWHSATTPAIVRVVALQSIH